MGQVTIYLDHESEQRVRAAAAAAGMPVSRWVAQLVQKKTQNEWPSTVRALAGAWQDLPDLDTLRKDGGGDVARERF